MCLPGAGHASILPGLGQSSRPGWGLQGMGLLGKICWVSLALLGALALGMIAIARGEPVNAVWLVAAAGCIFALGYRFYSRFVAYRVLELNDRRATPAERLEDGQDFVPTNKWVVFGHHFAAIAGPGPLVGPI